MNEVSKDSYKVLKHIAKHSSLPKEATRSIVKQLLDAGYVFYESGKEYFSTVPISYMDRAYFITESGKAYLESKQWFDLQYFITHILVPILVGVASSVVTTILLNALR